MEGFEAGPPAEADEAAVVAAAPPKTKTEKLLGIFSLSLAIVLFALDGTMVSVAIPAMVKDLGGEDLLSWIGTAYLLSSTALGPLWGKLGDVLGRKELLLFNICFFILSSVVCALAPSMVVLIIGRGLQGVGGGGMQAGVYVLIADIVTLRERGVYQALMGSIAGVSAILGPLLGGVITDGWSWRGCFWINIPVGVIGFAGVFFALKVPRRAKAPWKVTLARIDYGGAILCVTGSLPPRPDVGRHVRMELGKHPWTIDFRPRGYGLVHRLRVEGPQGAQRSGAPVCDAQHSFRILGQLLRGMELDCKLLLPPPVLPACPWKLAHYEWS